MREIIKVSELVRRMAEQRPRVLIAPDLPDGRIVHERATEDTFGPQMRRMSLYAMSPGSYHWAVDKVRAQWGVRPDFEESYLGRILGRSFRIPLRFPDGVREWEVQL